MQLPHASWREATNANGAPLLPKLRGEFAEFLNEGSHSHLRIFSSPTCVGLRYGYPKDSLEDFLGSVASTTLRALRLSLRHLRECDPPDLPGGSPYRSEPTRPIVGSHSLLRLPIVITSLRQFWNINQISIRYAFRPRVRTRLTLSGRTFLRKP